MSYVIALDAGTTSSRALLFDRKGQVCGISQMPFEQHFPQPGWVEHDPFDILGSQIGSLREVMSEHGLGPADIDAIGITNQRETTVLWNRETGLPYGNAIVWQCRRTSGIIEELCSDPAVRERIVATTGLVPDAYFSASKIKWIMDNVEGVAEDAAAGKVMFGTVDCWLVYNLTGGQVHATDFTNASRTMLFDIHKGQWDPWLCELFGVPASVLPEVRPSSGEFGHISQRIPAAEAAASQIPTDSPTKALAYVYMPSGIPICGVAGDQQSALFGHCCTKAGQAKNTYGTGCFLLMHTGAEAIRSRANLLTTIAASEPGVDHLEYALEGSVFVAGALVQWLRDQLGLLRTAAESERVASSVDDTAGVYIVPAFTGLGAPYWDSDARGAIYGITRGVSRAHIVRAGLEAIAYQVYDVMSSMAQDAGVSIDEMAVDGGAASNDFLMQFQADIMGTTLLRPSSTEVTAAGAAYLAGLACGFWQSIDEVRSMRVIEHAFEPDMDEAGREELLGGWRHWVERTCTDGGA